MRCDAIHTSLNMHIGVVELSLQVSRLVCDSLARVLQADSSRGSWRSRRECTSLHVLHSIASESRRRHSPLQLAPRVRVVVKRSRNEEAVDE